MESEVTKRGEMSQDLGAPRLHPSVVSGRAVDPASTRTRQAYNALSASSVGLELGLSVMIGLGFGYWLDTKVGTKPWMMLLFLVFGLVAGFRGVMRAVTRAERAAEAESRG